MGMVGDLKDGYGLAKEVAGDAWNVGMKAAPYLYGDKELDGTPTAPANGQSVPVPDGGFKPTAGPSLLGQAVDGVMGLFS